MCRIISRYFVINSCLHMHTPYNVFELHTTLSFLFMFFSFHSLKAFLYQFICNEANVICNEVTSSSPRGDLAHNSLSLRYFYNITLYISSQFIAYESADTLRIYASICIYIYICTHVDISNHLHFTNKLATLINATLTATTEQVTSSI